MSLPSGASTLGFFAGNCTPSAASSSDSVASLRFTPMLASTTLNAGDIKAKAQDRICGNIACPGSKTTGTSQVQHARRGDVISVTPGCCHESGEASHPRTSTFEAG